MILSVVVGVVQGTVPCTTPVPPAAYHTNGISLYFTRFLYSA